MSEIRESHSLDNPSGSHPVSSTPTPNCEGKKRSNRKRRRRSRISMDDSTHSDNFNPNAFWQNYQKASQWGNNQEVAYWRSKAVALDLENKMLRQQIQILLLKDDKIVFPPHIPFPVGGTNTFLDSSDQCSPNNVNAHAYKRRRRQRGKRRLNQLKSDQPKEVPVEKTHDSQVEFEVTEELKDFFELHMRHKMEQEKKQLDDKKKYEEAATAAGEKNAKLISQPINFGARADELKLLYGDASPKIHGMETAIQLTFRRHCEKTDARLWPNIPLRL